MPTLDLVKNDVDNFILEHLPILVARQENFRTNRGLYWQGLPTHVVCPNHDQGVMDSTIGDNLDATPSDEFSSWLAVFPGWETLPLPACFSVDTYSTVEGQGWVIVIEIMYKDVIWRRSVNVGPQSFRTFAWKIPDPGPGG